MITKVEMKKLKTHSAMQKGGMNSTHMKNMTKFMKNGDSFIVAHNKSKRLDKNNKKQKRSGY